MTSRFPALTSLTVSANQLGNITRPLSKSITSLTLEDNDIGSISTLHHLTALENLQHLSLRGCNISTITNDPHGAIPDVRFPPSLSSLDLSRNNITSWTFLNQLSILFPGLTTLRLSGNALYDQPPLPPSIAAATSTMSAPKPMTIDEGFMLTLSRFPPNLRTLNYSSISAGDRSNAEMYYLSLIGKELSATSAEEEQRVLAAHPRYAELCDLYGEPKITRATLTDGSGQRVIHPRSVAARLVKLSFRLSGASGSSEETGSTRFKEVPASFNTYQVKALVSRLFHLTPYSFKLVWETDEWDPIEKGVGDENAAEWAEDSEDEVHEPTVDSASTADKSRFLRREVELVDSTRDIGFLFQDETGELRIKVEVAA